MRKKAPEEPICNDCGCQGPLYLHGRCHPAAKTWTVIHPDNTLVVECGECGKSIARFIVEQQLPLRV